MGEQQAFLKVLSADNQSCHGGSFDWTEYLPTADGPGKPLPVIDNPVMCTRGYHWTTEAALMQQWAKAHMRVYVVEPSDDVTKPADGGKSVSSGGRLVSEYALPPWWQEAMRFIREDVPATPWLVPDGQPQSAWRVFPTWDAARDAAGDAARDATRGAARGAAWAAAWDAARDAARAAARAAAWDAAWDAARDAARAAAWDAALYTQCVQVCDGTDLADEHRQHARDRWEVWRTGYGLARVVAGVFYVYEAVS